MNAAKRMGLSRNMPDEDSRLNKCLQNVNPRLVFIVGLHRSGTTFLYESLVRLLPLAYLTPYHIVYYRRLLSRHKAGTADEDRTVLDQCMSEWGQSDRGIDAISLSSAMPEEYGWLLKRYAGSMRFGPRTALLFDEMCRKLLLTQDREVVLLKNPWDTARAVDIHKCYPQARFVYIARDPVAILQSQLRNALLFSSTPSPYLDLLLSGFRMGKLWFKIQRLLYRRGGEKLFARVMLPVLMRDIIGELLSYHRTFEALPEDRRVQVSYGQLTTQPKETLARICEFLEMSPTRDLEEIEPHPRNTPLHPQILRVKDHLLSRLSALGLPVDEAVA